MTTWIALLRGINVGGHNRLPMAELRADLASLQFGNVRTYIQSGNVVFETGAGTAASLTRKIIVQIEKRHGFRPHVILLKQKDLQAAVKANPFADAVAHPKTLHFFFLSHSACDADTDALDKAKAPTENYKLTSRVFYLHAPDGIGRSKLAVNAERHLGVATTARNYRTVDKLLSLAKQASL